MKIFKNLGEALDAIVARDPAARSRLEVALLYPSFHAVMLYRLTHRMWRNGLRLPARMLSQLARFMTGIEIHPGARIGRRLFIDHAMGVVVGETAEIGDDVTLYHDVTLGGTAPSVNSAAQVNRKRHPTLENDVIVGAGAQVLGPITVGQGARVGANAVVVRPVPPGATVVGIPAREIDTAPAASSAGCDFIAYGTPTSESPDPVLRALNALCAEVNRLRSRVEELERLREGAGSVKAPGWGGDQERQPRIVVAGEDR